MSRLLVFCVVTCVLPGLGAAALWRRWVRPPAALARWDTLLWIAASPFLVATAYGCALRVVPGRPSGFYVALLTGGFAAVPVVFRRETGALCAELYAALRARITALRRAFRWRRHGLPLLVAGALLVLYARLLGMAVNLPIAGYDALTYATAGRDIHVAHSVDAWTPGRPNARGFLLHESANKNPCFEFLNAWAADWMAGPHADAPVRALTPAYHLLALAPLAFLARRSGRVGFVWTAALYLTAPTAALRATGHFRESFLLLGLSLAFAALVRAWRLPFRPRLAVVTLGIAAGIAPHPLGLLAVGLLLVAWIVASRGLRMSALGVTALALPLAVALGGKQYVRNFLTTGNPDAAYSWPFPGVEPPLLAQQAASGADEPEADAWTALGLRGVLDRLGGDAVPGAPPDAVPSVAALALAGIIAGVAWPGRTPVRRGRILCAAAVGTGVYLAVLGGLLDPLYAGEGRALSARFAYVPRYNLAAYPVLIIVIVHGLRALRRRRVARRVVQAAAAACVVVGFSYLWDVSHFQWRHYAYPDAPPAGRGGVVSFDALAQIARTIDGAPVLVLEDPFLLYYTDVHGYSWLNSALAPVYAADTPEARLRALWALGVRYVAVRRQESWFAPQPFSDRQIGLGFPGLLGNRALARPVGGGAVTMHEGVTLYALEPPAA